MLEEESTMSDLKSAAIEAAQIGLRVFPLKARSKEPRMTGGFKNATNDPGHVGGLWSRWPDANIGLSLPPDVVVLDLDDEKGIERVRDLDLPSGATVVKTGRGFQGYYATPPGCTLRQGPLDGVGDIKVSGSGYTILPPSVHPSGSTYAYAKGSLQGILNPPRITEEHVEAIERLRRGGTTSSTGAAPVLPDAIPVGQRNQTLASLAGSMRNRGSSPQAILGALRIENEARCVPPLADDEVERIANSIARYAPAPSKLALAVELPTLATEQPSSRRTSWTATDLLSADLPEPRYAIDGLFPEGLAFMAGAPKLGKSWMGLGLAIAVASGGNALSSIRVERGDVLYLALEDNARRLQDRLRLLLNGSPAPEGLHLELEWPRLDSGGAERLVEWLGAHPTARLVLIDVYPRLRPQTGSNRDRYQTDYASAALLQAIAVGHAVAVVALYHTRKAEASDFVETVQGTFGTAGAADTIVVVKRARGEADATLHITGRDVEERELALRFAAEVGTWELLGDAEEHDLSKTRGEGRRREDALGGARACRGDLDAFLTPRE
jgi:Bifunctional DNA primase/polymerase, N-terminal/AAA domain/Primase C terminal 1 (PriCT-1)